MARFLSPSRAAGGGAISLLLVLGGILLIARGLFRFGPAVLLLGLFGFLQVLATRRPARLKVLSESFQVSVLVALTLGAFLWAMGAELTGDRPLIVDFTPIYSGASLLWEDPGRLYDVEAQLQAERAATGLDLQRVNFLPFAYPPATALVFLPLAAFRFAVAYQLFTVLNLVLLAVVLSLLVARLALSRDDLRVLVLVTVAWMPVYIGLVQGQTSFLILVILTLFFLDLQEERERRAGIWAGLLAIKPQLLLIPVLILVRLRMWRAFVASVLVLGLLALVSLALVGWSGLEANWSLLQRMGAGAEPTAEPSNMYNLRAIGAYLGLGDWFWLSLGLGVVVIVFWAFGNLDPALAAALAILGIVLVSPHSNPHDGILAITVLALFQSYRRKPLNFPKLLGLTGVSFLPVGTYLIWTLGGSKIPLMPLFFLGVWVYCLRAGWAGRTTSPGGLDAPGRSHGHAGAGAKERDR